MKYLNLLLLLLITIVNIQSQALKPVVIKDASENYYYRIINESKNIALLNWSLDLLSKGNNYSRERLKYVYKNKEFFPLHYEELDSTKYWIIWKDKIDSNIIIHSTIFNPTDGKFELLDSIKIRILSNDLYYTSRVNYAVNQKIFFITINPFVSGKRSFYLVKMNQSGNFSQYIKIDSSSGNTYNKMRGLHVIYDYVVLNPNKYMLTGYTSSVVSLLDSNGISLLTRPLIYYDPKKNISKQPFTPSLILIDSNTVKVSDDYPYQKENFPENNTYNLKVIGDSMYIDNFNVISNKENLPKAQTKITSFNNQEFYIAANVDYQVPLNSNFPSSFFLTKLNENQEVWHKQYKSDYYFHVMDLKMVDSCTLIVCGSVFDYFSNGYLQGFYALIDCDGNVINSNIDLLNSDIEIYPNPANEYITINHHYPDNIDADLININGHVVAEFKQICQDEPHVIHVGNIVRGIYFLRMRTRDNVSIYSIRIILE